MNEKRKLQLKQQFGPWAIVTGASSGIGFEIASTLAISGINLVINGRDENRLREAASKLRNAHIEIKSVVADLSNSIGVDQLIQACKGLEIGLLVNNAGFGTSGEFTSSQSSTEINMLKLNCESVLALTHFFAPIMKAQKRGGIVFLSSIVAYQGVPYAANYAATKAYIHSLAEALTLELKPHHVQVLTASPGPVNTSFGERANMKMGSAASAESVAKAIVNALGRQSVVVPGFLSKVLLYSLKTAPRFIKVRIMQAVMSGFTRHQRINQENP